MGEKTRAHHTRIARKQVGIARPVSLHLHQTVEKNEFIFDACLFRALRSIRQAVALLPGRQYAQLCAAMFSLRCEHTPRFFRYFAHLRRQLRRSCGRNVREYAPTRIQACFLASASNYRKKKKGLFIVACLFRACAQYGRQLRYCPEGNTRNLPRYVLDGSASHLASIRAAAARLCSRACSPASIRRACDSNPLLHCAKIKKNIKKFKKYRHIFFSPHHSQ